MVKLSMKPIGAYPRSLMHRSLCLNLLTGQTTTIQLITALAKVKKRQNRNRINQNEQTSYIIDEKEFE